VPVQVSTPVVLTVIVTDVLPAAMVAPLQEAVVPVGIAGKVLDVKVLKTKVAPVPPQFWTVPPGLFTGVVAESASA
jgi:hypothetical protein